MNKLFLLGLLILPACNKDEPNTDSSDTAVTELAPQGRIGGFVTDQHGTALEGVSVSVQGISTTTNADGSYLLLEVQPGSDLVVEFGKRGYATNYKVTTLLNWETVATSASLLEIDGSETFASNVAGSFVIEETTVNFQADSFVNKNTGVRYDGNVTLEITHVDPSTSEIAGAPRDLSAISDSDDSQLVSYGMVNVSLFGEDGQELSIDSSLPATLNIPIANGDLPESLQMADGAIQTTWSYDPIQGKWLEESSGTVNQIDDELYFTFEAPHFSWWNCDMGFVPSCASGRVIDVSGFPIRGADVTCAGGQTTSTAVTDENGDYVCSIMVGDTVDITGQTFVSQRSWQKTNGGIYMDSEGSSAAECEPIEDIQIDVCRIAGSINVQNYEANADIDNPSSINSDTLTALFWDPPGDVSYCVNPLNDLDAGECWSGTSEEIVSMFPESAFPGIPQTARSAGTWVEVSTDRNDYRMDRSYESGLPFYLWDVHEVSGDEVITTRPEFDEGQSLGLEAEGDFASYFGPWKNPAFVTIPNQLTIESPFIETSGGPLSINYGNTSDDFVFFSAIVAEQQVLCKFEDSGRFNVPSTALSQLEPGWGGAAVYNLSLTLQEGPDGLPVYAQVHSGYTVPFLVE